MTIVEFLEARIAEDEEAARREVDLMAGAIRGVRVEISYEWSRHISDPNAERRMMDPVVASAPGAPSPVRVLREVAAKRGILEAHAGRSPRSSRLDSCRICEDPYTYGPEAWPCDTVRYLASIYKDHPDFNKHTEGGWTI